MAYFLALDVGGTKTDYALADEGRVLARVRSGSLKRMRVDAATASAHLDAALAQLSAQSGVALQQVSRTCVGTAGQTVPLVTDFLREAVGARVGGRLLLLGDVEILLDAAFPGQAGVVAIAGTGSNVAGRALDGQVLTVGGWGPALADHGSGYRIGHQALRAVCLARDEERSNALYPAILDFWQMHSFEHLVEHANASPAPDFSQLTHVVLRCATEGDGVAQEVLEQAGAELGHLICVLIRRLRAASPEFDAMGRLAFTGSILENVGPVREALLRTVHREFPGVRALSGVVDPLLGALWRARTGEGFDV